MKTYFCIASGPSLTMEDVEYCRGKGKVYAVKEAALMAPWADVLYAADHDWWVNHKDRWQGFKGEKWTLENRAAEIFPELKTIKCRTEWKWSTTPGVIATGGNSGFQVINMAVLDGAQQVILLGYDYGYDPANQHKHWWDNEHPRESRCSNYVEWNKRLSAAAPLIQVPVINATRKTAITCFPRAKIQEIL